jgi:predicted transcriptional regulator
LVPAELRHLTAIQREVLETLVKLYEQHKRMIKSKEVARVLGKDEGTVRNIIMWLKSLGLVESRTGPAGGYMPTLKAYEVLGSYSPYNLSIGYGQVMVYKESGEEYRYSAVNMELLDIFSSEPIKAVVRVTGDLSPVEEGDRARVESVPRRRFALEGTVRRVSKTAGELLIEVKKISVIPDEKVGNIVSRKLIKVREDMSVRKVAKILYSHGIRGAPVENANGEIVGFITTTDIAMLVARGEDLDAPVKNYMRRNVFTINENEPILEAMRYMDFQGVGRLLVVDYSGKPVGIVTRTDILRYLLALS